MRRLSAHLLCQHLANALPGGLQLAQSLLLDEAGLGMQLLQRASQVLSRLLHMAGSRLGTQPSVEGYYRREKSSKQQASVLGAERAVMCTRSR
jgi:hypothetical protein